MKRLKELFLWGTLFFVVLMAGCSSTTSARVPSDYSPSQREVLDLASLFVNRLGENSYAEVMSIVNTNELEYWFRDKGDGNAVKKGGYQDFASRLESFYQNAALRKVRLAEASLPVGEFSDEAATVYGSFSYEYEIIAGESKGSIASNTELIQMGFKKEQKEWRLAWLTAQYGHGLLFPIKIKGY